MGEPGAQPRGRAVELGAYGLQQILLLAASFAFRDREKRLFLTE
jgi:hypothetical protein